MRRAKYSVKSVASGGIKLVCHVEGSRYTPKKDVYTELLSTRANEYKGSATNAHVAPASDPSAELKSVDDMSQVGLAARPQSLLFVSTEGRMRTAQDRSVAVGCVEIRNQVQKIWRDVQISCLRGVQHLHQLMVAYRILE